MIDPFIKAMKIWLSILFLGLLNLGSLAQSSWDLTGILIHQKDTFNIHRWEALKPDKNHPVQLNEVIVWTLEEGKLYEKRKQNNDQKIKRFASWVTTDLYFGQGNYLHYLDEFVQIYEQERQLSFANGLLVKDSMLDNRRTYISRYNAKWELLNAAILSQIEWEKVPDMGQDTVPVYINLTSGNNRKPQHIRFLRKHENELYNQLAYRAVESLPEWDLYYYHGKPFAVTQGFPVQFSEAHRKLYENPEAYLIKIFEGPYDEPGVPSGYANLLGEPVIPLGKYDYCYSDTLRNFAIVRKEGEIIGINRKEEILFEVFAFDNGPDYPQEGLFRIVKQGKMGFADNSGHIIVKPQFYFAFPFNEGKAKICYSGELVQDGEHSRVHSEEWFYLDRKTLAISKF